MTTPPREKVSITLPPDLAARARAACGGNRQFSDYVAKAVKEKLLNDAMAEYARIRGADPLDDVHNAVEADAA